MASKFQDMMRAAGVATARMRRELATPAEPKTEEQTEITVSLRGEELAALDAWIAERPEPKPGRGEAMRLLLAAALRKG